MLFVFAKIVFTPLLLLLCTFATHRWGSGVGGWLLGLPLTSGPISVFLFAEHGPTFAEHAAQATLLGVAGAAIFCVCYSLTFASMQWWQSLSLAYGACLATAWVLSIARLGLTGIVVAVVVLLTGLAVVLRVESVVHAALGETARDVGAGLEHEGEQDGPSGVPDGVAEAGPASGLPGRMLVAAVSVVAITAAAALLGPRVGGLLAPLPVLAAVMAASSHRRGARSEADGLLRGAVVGSWGGVAFFAVVAFMLPGAGPLLTYGVATLAALAAGAIAVSVRRRSRAVFQPRDVAEA